VRRHPIYYVILKKFTATKLKKIKTEPESRREWMLERFKLAAESHTRNKKNQFWQYGNHPEEIYTDKLMVSWIIFILTCSCRYSRKASQYIYSSATNYVFDVY
jgi:uncharacterized protein YcnI